MLHHNKKCGLMSQLGQFLPKSDVCVMSVQLPNNGLKLDVAALRIGAKAEGILKCAPRARQFHAAVLTVCRAWWSSNCAGLR
jgi:hypothetical protein